MKTNLCNVGLAIACFITPVAVADTVLPVIADEVKFTLSDAELTGVSGQHLSQIVEHEGAAFIKLHFKQLSLPKGAVLRVKSATTDEMVEYTDSQLDWFAQSISGDALVIELIANAKGQQGQFELDYYMAGKDTAEQEMSTLSTCGVNERKDVACWEDSHPEKVAWTTPVARLLINGRSLCTAWRVGPDNRMFTNNHCVESGTLTLPYARR